MILYNWLWFEGPIEIDRVNGKYLRYFFYTELTWGEKTNHESVKE